MSKQILNSFVSYEFTPRELLEANLLNPLQKQMIQNEMSQVAQQILGLKYLPQDPLSFVQEDSFLKGQLSILQTLLERCSESELQLSFMTQPV